MDCKRCREERTHNNHARDTHEAGVKLERTQKKGQTEEERREAKPSPEGTGERAVVVDDDYDDDDDDDDDVIAGSTSLQRCCCSCC